MINQPVSMPYKGQGYATTKAMKTEKIGAISRNPDLYQLARYTGNKVTLLQRNRKGFYTIELNGQRILASKARELLINATK